MYYIYILIENNIPFYIGKTNDLKQRLKTYNGDKKDDIIPLYVYETDDIDEIERCHNAGANVVVIGNAIENDIDFLLDIANYQKLNEY
jgi:excinuclease UvrABC nuclease subunit